jgi:Leucine-rich repeat (LRR) protein
MPALHDLSTMQSWDPESLTKISFSNMKLTQFHIGTLVNLEELDLSHNQVTTLLGTGIEQSSHLKKFNISHNRIVSKRQLLALQ